LHQEKRLLQTASNKKYNIARLGRAIWGLRVFSIHFLTMQFKAKKGVFVHHSYAFIFLFLPLLLLFLDLALVVALLL
jgi:hypothetical protein